MTRPRPDRAALPYRPNVAIALFDRQGRLFVARRADMADIWQCPQGGIDPGETPREAALRELEEETGTRDATVLAEREGWIAYDFPPDVHPRGPYRGQRQKWFVLGFDGKDSDIRLDRHSPPEFDAWEWIEPRALLRRDLGFKHDLYATVLPEIEKLYQAACKDWLRTSRA